MHWAALAERQLADYDRHVPGTIFDDSSFSLNLADAYQLQREVAALRLDRGEALAGYKIGCVSPTMQAQLGIDRPVFGHLWQSELRPSPAVLSLAGFDGLAIEGEFAVRMGDNGACAAFAVIELHNYVFRGSGASAPQLVANNAIHAGVVMPLVEPPLGDLDELLDEPISVYCNGSLLGSSSGRELPGGPRASLGHLTEYLAAYWSKLRAGQIVLTGTPLPLYRVQAGDRILVRSPRNEVTAVITP